ncbi:MAG: type II toxin-antitoxin system RelE/ParE family toxin [Sideroxyarcus sp.]|nr:type II toxin-antitoxin system RelE/ParE family toxin [Sideroxyarcus sp.]
MSAAVRLDFSILARKDLLDIARYIARDNPQNARNFVIDLRQQCALLSKQPGLGVARIDLAEGLRMLPYGRYLIFFSATEFGILVERVLHSARNLSPLFNTPSDLPPT